jgi:hypothetical protein
MRKLGTYAVLVVTAAAAAAQTPVTPETSRTGVNNDPDEIVCIRQEEIGSRVRGRRVCRTRAQWEEYRALNRETVDRVQIQSKQTACPPVC